MPTHSFITVFASDFSFLIFIIMFPHFTLLDSGRFGRSMITSTSCAFPGASSKNDGEALIYCEQECSLSPAFISWVLPSVPVELKSPKLTVKDCFVFELLVTCTVCF